MNNLNEGVDELKRIFFFHCGLLLIFTTDAKKIKHCVILPLPFVLRSNCMLLCQFGYLVALCGLFPRQYWIALNKDHISRNFSFLAALVITVL